MLLLSTYVKSAFMRGVVRQALFYVLCLILIYLGVPVLDRIRGGYHPHGGVAIGLYLGLFFLSMVLTTINLLRFNADTRVSNTGALLVNALYLGGIVLIWLIKVYQANYAR